MNNARTLSMNNARTLSMNNARTLSINNARTRSISMFFAVALAAGVASPGPAAGMQTAQGRLFKEESKMELEQFSRTTVPSESPTNISLLTIYEESARASKLPRNDGSLSLSWGYNVDTANDGVSAEPVRGLEAKEHLSKERLSKEHLSKEHLSKEPLANEAMETRQLSSNDKMSEPRGAVKDQYGNLTRFKIGPESEEAQVSVSYDDPSAKPPTVRNTTVTRADGDIIDYVREKDPADPNAPFIYTETRNGSRGDLLYGSFDVAQDGRMTLYFDFEKKRPAITFNPKTGYEEYP